MEHICRTSNIFELIFVRIRNVIKVNNRLINKLLLILRQLFIAYGIVVVRLLLVNLLRLLSLEVLLLFLLLFSLQPESLFSRHHLSVPLFFGSQLSFNLPSPHLEFSKVIFILSIIENSRFFNHLNVRVAMIVMVCQTISLDLLFEVLLFIFGLRNIDVQLCFL